MVKTLQSNSHKKFCIMPKLKHAKKIRFLRMTDILSRHNFEAIKFSLINCFKMLRDKISFIRTNLRINDKI